MSRCHRCRHCCRCLGAFFVIGSLIPVVAARAADSPQNKPALAAAKMAGKGAKLAAAKNAAKGKKPLSTATAVQKATAAVNRPLSRKSPAPTLSVPTAVPTAAEPDIKALLNAVSPEGYTGLVFDCRHLPQFQRTPAPEVYGPEPDSPLLYPDRKHVPTPDEVQDQSIIRYYLSEEAMRGGFVGSNPLVIKAIAACGPGHDGVRISAEDQERIRMLDSQIHFTLTWKVGVLLPEGK